MLCVCVCNFLWISHLRFSWAPLPLAGLVGVGVMRGVRGNIKGANVSCPASAHKHTRSAPALLLCCWKEKQEVRIHVLKPAAEALTCSCEYEDAQTHIHTACLIPSEIRLRIRAVPLIRGTAPAQWHTCWMIGAVVLSTGQRSQAAVLFEQRNIRNQYATNFFIPVYTYISPEIQSLLDQVVEIKKNQ